MNFDDFNGIEWQSNSHGKQGRDFWLRFFVVLMMVFLSIGFAMWSKKPWGLCPLIISTFLIVIYAGFYSKKACWYNSKMIFAASNQGIMFSQKLNNSYFHETFDNVSGYAYRSETNNLTSVIVYFKKPAEAGAMGRLKEIRMIKIENFDDLKKVLENNNIPQMPYPSK